MRMQFTPGWRPVGTHGFAAFEEVELEPEVADWFLALDEDDQARVGLHVDRLGGSRSVAG